MPNNKEYTYEELVQRISELIRQKRYYEEDNICLQNRIDDPIVFYQDKVEDRNEMRSNNNQIRIIESELKELLEYAISKSMPMNSINNEFKLQ